MSHKTDLIVYKYRQFNKFSMLNKNTAKPVLRGHLWDKEKVSL